MSRFQIGVMCAALLASITAAQAQNVPLKLQAALFAKLFKYDQKLELRDRPVQVLVVHGTNTDDAMAMAQVMTGAGMQARLGTLDELASALATADVAYAMPDAPAEQIGKACVKVGALSTSGVASDADKGLVSVALGLKEDGRPLIVVNVTQAAREGHSFSAQLLALAKVVR